MARSKKPQKSSPYREVDKIEVYVWGKFVGAAALDPALGYYAFAYDRGFGKSGIELSPVQMPLNETEQPYVFTNLPVATFKRLPSLLADALPDDFGNALIDSYMAEKGISKERITSLDRLAYMGKRGIGALEFRPARGPKKEKPTAIKLGNLVEEARTAVRGTTKTDKHADATLRNIIEVGTSAGGARAKAVIAWNKKTEEIRTGQADAPEGFEHWLLKFDGMGDDKELGASQAYGRIEFAYYLMAKAAGIQMSECRLLEENGRSHFMTKRFDREGGNVRHHMQTLCAMSHLDYKKKAANSYEQLFITNRQLSLDQEANIESFRRMAFNVMAKNCDDHTKNFSFLLREGGAWELAPAYDVTFAHNPKGDWTNQHLMSVNGKFKDFRRSDLMEVANRFGIGQASAVLKEVQSAVKKWPSFAKQAAVPQKDLLRIQKFHLTLK